MRNAFDNMADTLTHRHYSARAVPDEEYSAWQDQWLFDKIAGKRMGESFCDYFAVAHSTPLYYFRDDAVCADWIKKNYLEK